MTYCAMSNHVHLFVEVPRRPAPEDLDPVRAGIVSDPKDYRWSGYGEAVAGRKLARAGIQRALGSGGGPRAAMGKYRALLYESGEARKPGENGEAGRAGFSVEEIDAVLTRGGKLELGEALRCRVRYFSDGAVLGSRAFVERVFRCRRDCFEPACYLFVPERSAPGEYPRDL